jgi:hypothetical protein
VFSAFNSPELAQSLLTEVAGWIITWWRPWLHICTGRQERSLLDEDVDVDTNTKRNINVVTLVATSYFTNARQTFDGHFWYLIGEDEGVEERGVEWSVFEWNVCIQRMPSTSLKHGMRWTIVKDGSTEHRGEWGLECDWFTYLCRILLDAWQQIPSTVRSPPHPPSSAILGHHVRDRKQSTNIRHQHVRR